MIYYAIFVQHYFFLSLTNTITTMGINKRVLKQIDMEDAMQADEIFQLLMGEEVEPRRKFIEDNALNVMNLDV